MVKPAGTSSAAPGADRLGQGVPTPASPPTRTSDTCLGKAALLVSLSEAPATDETQASAPVLNSRTSYTGASVFRHPSPTSSMSAGRRADQAGAQRWRPAAGAARPQAVRR